MQCKLQCIIYRIIIKEENVVLCGNSSRFSAGPAQMLD